MPPPASPPPPQINPRLDSEAANRLRDKYVAIREAAKRAAIENGPSPIPITVRQLEAIVRTSEAHARMRLAAGASISHPRRETTLRRVHAASQLRLREPMQAHVLLRLRRVLDRVHDALLLRGHRLRVGVALGRHAEEGDVRVHEFAIPEEVHPPELRPQRSAAISSLISRARLSRRVRDDFADLLGPLHNNNNTRAAAGQFQKGGIVSNTSLHAMTRFVQLDPSNVLRYGLGLMEMQYARTALSLSL